MMRKMILLISMLLLITAPLLAQDSNIMVNGSMEVMEPAFWSKVNDGVGGAQAMWADDTSHSWYRSFKIMKPSATDDMVGWKSVNNADLYWNNAAADRLYSLSFWAKTEGVNTSPATDDAKIGVKYEFYANGSLLGEQFVEIDQSAADMNWAEYTGGLLIPAGDDPDEVYVTAYMGKDATGTVWFDNVNAGSDPWSMGVFNADAETSIGWLYWTAGPDKGVFKIDDTVAHTGQNSVSLEDWDSDSDELVWYSAPVAAKPNTWYRVTAWVKHDTVNTDPSFLPTNVTPVRDDERIGFTFFFHRDPIERGWSLTPGDIFYYIDQRTASSADNDWADANGWVKYTVVFKSPEEAAGVSLRARFTSFPTGKVWFDDFSIEEITPMDEMMVNGSMEVMEPGFWNKVNDGVGGAQAMWTDDTSHSWYRSFKVMKPSATDDIVGWKSVNNADLYWNNAAADRLYSLSFWAKTEGVNTSPANDDAKIGVKYEFYANGSLLGEQFVELDQSAADMNWAQYTGGLLIPAGDDPDEVYVTAYMGKDATGTVWFDNVNAGSDPWSMGVFNADAETPTGWLYWTAGPDKGVFKIDDTVAHQGQNSVSLEDWDSDSDELVWYSAPVPAKPNTGYMVSAWVKHDTVSTGASFLPSNVTPVRDDERVGFTFFFHRDPIDRGWSLTPGDIFFYIDQRTAASADNDWADANGWVKYTVVFKSPEEAAGVSLRARFTSFPTGKVWFDHFSIKELETVLVSVEENPTHNTTLVPSEFGLSQNYPNPFNPTTIIEYMVPKAGKVRIDIFNALGQKVKTVVDAEHAQGTYRAVWDGTTDSGQKMTSGIYFYRLQAQGALITRKMIFTK